MKQRCWKIGTAFKTPKGVNDHIGMGCPAPFAAHVLPGHTSRAAAKAAQPSSEDDRLFRGPTTSRSRKGRDVKAQEHSGLPCGFTHPGENHAAFLNTHGSQPLSEATEIARYNRIGDMLSPPVSGVTEAQLVEYVDGRINRLATATLKHIHEINTRIDNLVALEELLGESSPHVDVNRIDNSATAWLNA